MMHFKRNGLSVLTFYGTQYCELPVTETLKEGKDITVVTYGAMCNIAIKAAEDLEAVGISCEVIDVSA